MSLSLLLSIHFPKLGKIELDDETGGNTVLREHEPAVLTGNESKTTCTPEHLPADITFEDLVPPELLKSFVEKLHMHDSIRNTCSSEQAAGRCNNRIPGSKDVDSQCRKLLSLELSFASICRFLSGVWKPFLSSDDVGDHDSNDTHTHAHTIRSLFHAINLLREKQKTAFGPLVQLLPQMPLCLDIMQKIRRVSVGSQPALDGEEPQQNSLQELLEVATVPMNSDAQSPDPTVSSNSSDAQLWDKVDGYLLC
jgi:hypothetical protein